MMKINKNYGILFWVTGLAGSGKTRYAKILRRSIAKNFGPTIVLSGDDIRKSFNLKGYSYFERKKILIKYQNLIKLIISQKINVIFAVIGMVEEIRKKNRKIFKNYFEIYIKADFSVLKKNNKKKLYVGKKANVVGKDIKPEFPKKPDIIFVNNFRKDLKKQVEDLYQKIKKKLPNTFLV